MRVVFLTHNYPKHSGEVPGAFLHTLAIGLRGHGVDVRVVAPSEGGKSGCDVVDGVPVRRVRYADAAQETLAHTGTLASAVRSPQGLRALAGMIRALRTGARAELVGASEALVHAHWWMPAGLAAPPETPMVLTCHGSDVRLLQRSRMARWLGQIPLRRARVVTTVSHELATVIEDNSPARLSDDAIQPMPVRNVDRPWSLGGGGILVIGRLVEQKRVHLALDAFALARSRGVALRLTLVGDGPARAALRVQAGGLGLGDTVRFLGEVPPARVPELLATADLALMPAVGEGFGLAAAEALMQGVPVVACTDGGGLRDIVPSAGAGRVVPPDADAIAVAIGELLNDPTADDAARREGARWRERLSPEFVAERCLGWYRRALDA